MVLDLGLFGETGSFLMLMLSLAFLEVEALAVIWSGPLIATSKPCGLGLGVTTLMVPASSVWLVSDTAKC